MMPFLNVFRRIGGAFDVDDEGIRFWHPGGDLRSIALETDVHPGFMTDWQQPLVVALTQTTGLSIVHETVYENRLGFTDALLGLGRAASRPTASASAARRAGSAAPTSSTRP